jgi:hypothetical protein
MPAVSVRPAPVAKRIYLTGTKFEGYSILIKDNLAGDVIRTIDAPSYPAGNAMVRALRQLDTERGTIY